MARLLRFGFLFCSSVSSLFRASVFRSSSWSPITLLSCVVVLLIGVPFPAVYPSQITAFSSVPSSFVLCLLFHVSRFMFYCFISRIGFLWCLSVLDYGFGMFVFGIASMAAVYRHSSRPASILAALFLPHASSPSSSPPVSLLLSVFFRRRLLLRLRHLLRRSSPSPSSRNPLGLGLRPSTLGSSSVVLVVVGSRVDSRP